MNNTKYQDWIKKGLDKGLSDIEIFASARINLSIEVYDSKIESNEISTMHTAIIKGVYDNKMARLRVENLTDDNIDKMLDFLIDSAKNITALEPAIIFAGSDKYAEINETNFDFLTIDPTDKVDFLLNIEKGIKKHELTTTVQTVSYSESDSKTVIVNSKGLNLSKHHTYAMVYAIGVFEKDSQIKTGLDYQMIRDYNNFDLDTLVAGVIKAGIDQIGAKSVASKTYPVVFSNEMFGSILGAYDGIFSGEAAYRKLTKLIDKQGESIASDIVNLINDPLSKEALFKIPFDDQGVATKRRHLIKDGTFTDFAHNLKTAEIFKTESTGNGFGDGISYPNLYLEPGKASFDEVIKTIEEGIYITDLVGLHAGVETISGDFSLQAAGFKIKDGKLTEPVDMIVVSGNYFNLLKDIEMIGNDFKFGMSGIGSSSVKIKNLTIGGQ